MMHAPFPGHRPLAKVALLLFAAACRRDSPPDAWGNFEAIETVVAAQLPGPVLRFAVREGDQLVAGATVATIDTVSFALERQQLAAQRRAVAARGAEVAGQLKVLEAQREVASRTLARTQRLLAQQAATAQQLDQAERDHRTLTAQLDATRAMQQSVALEAAAVDARVAQARDRLARATVVNPVTGTVLATYTREGEVVGAGQPLYRIAPLDTLELRAWVSGAQLALVTLGQTVTVRVDAGADSLRAVPGTVTWIASQSEFTPTPVQTREERTDLVYGIKVRVANPDGRLRIGMPGEVTFGSRGTTASR